MDSHQSPAGAPRFISVPMFALRLGVSPRKVWRLIHTDPTFPKPRRIGLRGTRFLEAEADRYITGIDGGDAN